MKCPNCNAEIRDNAKFCTECREKIAKINTKKEPIDNISKKTNKN
ncbi:zinc ribbon domain-containing protein [Methanobrevibacter sp. 87.7]|nr:zinc ribbon domain-containing protein [Methanobrevibacter sp. 87.7]